MMFGLFLTSLFGSVVRELAINTLLGVSHSFPSSGLGTSILEAPLPLRSSVFSLKSLLAQSSYPRHR